MKIGNREVIFNQSLIVTRGELVEFDLCVVGQSMEFRMTFIEDVSKDPVSWTVEGNRVIMTFANWATRGAIMATLKTPFKLGVINGTPFGFQVACTSSGKVYDAHLIFMTGGEFDE